MVAPVMPPPLPPPPPAPPVRADVVGLLLQAANMPDTPENRAKAAIFLQQNPEQAERLSALVAQQMGAMPPEAMAPPDGPPMGAPPGDTGAPIPLPPPPSSALGPLGPPPSGPPPLPPMPPMPGQMGPLGPMPPEMGMAPPPQPPPPQVPPEVMAGVASLGERPKREVPRPTIASIKELRKRSEYGKTPPTWGEVMDHKRVALARFQGRDEHYDECWDLYDLINSIEKQNHPDGTPRDQLQGDVTHLWSRPAILVDRAVAAIEPYIERLIFQCDAWDSEQVTKEANQRKENFYRTQVRRWFNRWDERGTFGDPQPPMERKLALTALIEGGVGKRYVIDPYDDGVIFVEPVPLRELYPVGGAVLRVMDCTLAEARASYREIAEAWPHRHQDDDDDGADYPLDDQEVCVVVWTDVHGLWECIAWDFAPGSPYGRDGEYGSGGDQWIKKPTRIDLGFPSLEYGALWFGGAAASSRRRHSEGGGSRAGHDALRYRHRGILSPLLETFDRATQYISIIATLANNIGNEAWIWEYNPDAWQEAPTQDDYPSRLPGAVNALPQGEKVTPVPVNPASADALRALLTLLMQEVGDANPPVLAGGGAASSGAERYLAQTAAQDYVIAPASRYMCRWIEGACRHTGELVVRKGAGKGRLFDGIPFRAYKADTVEGRGAADVLEAEDVKLNGTDVTVKYKIDDPVRLTQLMNAWLMLHEKNVVDMDRVRDELGIEDGGRMDQGIAIEKARQDPVYTKMLIGKAIKGYVADGGDIDLLAIWASERMREQSPQGQAPGMPSPPGGAAPPGMAGAMNATMGDGLPGMG